MCVDGRKSIFAKTSLDENRVFFYLLHWFFGCSYKGKNPHLQAIRGQVVPVRNHCEDLLQSAAHSLLTGLNHNARPWRFHAFDQRFCVVIGTPAGNMYEKGGEAHPNQYFVFAVKCNSLHPARLRLFQASDKFPTIPVYQELYTNILNLVQIVLDNFLRVLTPFTL